MTGGDPNLRFRIRFRIRFRFRIRIRIRSRSRLPDPLLDLGDRRLELAVLHVDAAESVPSLERDLLFVRQLDDHVGLETLLVGGGPAREVIGRDRERERAAEGLEGYDALDGALAERALADEEGEPVLAERPGEDLARARALVVHEDRDRVALALGTTRRLEGLAHDGHSRPHGDDLLLRRDERVGDLDRLLEETARVVAEVDDEALDLLLVEI